MCTSSTVASGSAAIDGNGVKWLIEVARHVVGPCIAAKIPFSVVAGPDAGTADAAGGTSGCVVVTGFVDVAVMRPFPLFGIVPVRNSPSRNSGDFIPLLSMGQ